MTITNIKSTYVTYMEAIDDLATAILNAMGDDSFGGTGEWACSYNKNYDEVALYNFKTQQTAYASSTYGVHQAIKYAIMEHIEA